MTVFTEAKKRKRNQHYLSLRFTLCFLIFQNISFASTTVNADQNKRVSVAISHDSMNRIAFANDRISQVFGDEEAYTMQTDETRGQIFLKPTEANGEKPISITVTTENGVVQDLELTPKKRSTATIILKGEKPLDIKPSPDAFTPRASSAAFGSYSPLQQTPHAHSYNGQSSMGGVGDRTSLLTRALKDVASQDIPDTENDDAKPKTLNPDGLKAEGVRVIKTPDFAIDVYRLTNTSDDTRELVENALSGKNALALATVHRSLKPGEATLLYVARPL